MRRVAVERRERENLMMQLLRKLQLQRRRMILIVYIFHLDSENLN